MTTATIPSVYDGSPQKTSFFYKVGPDILGGTALTTGLVTGYSNTKPAVFFKRLTELLNDPAQPIDFLRIKELPNYNTRYLMTSLGVVQDDVTGEWVLNKEQTKLLGDSLKQDKVLWDPAEGYVPGNVPAAAPVVTTAGTPVTSWATAPVTTPVMSVPPPVAPLPVPSVPVASTLSSAYGYDFYKANELTKNYTNAAYFDSKTLSFGKFGPSLADDWGVAPASGHVVIKWGFDDHKGTRIAHIRSVTGGGNAANQSTALVAHLQQRFINDYFVTHPELSRVIIDKKALAGNPKFEQMLKDAGWKETKAYYTTDKAGLTAFTNELDGDKAAWQKVATLPVAPLAVPAGAGANVTIPSTLVMPKATSKIAAPSFIYGYDKSALDAAYGSLVTNDLGVIASKGGDAQTYELVSGSVKGSWSISPSAKTVGWFDFTGTGDPVADAPGAFAMLRKIAEDAQNRSADFWVKPEVYDKVVGMRQMLLDAGGTETSYANLGTAIKMPAKDASKFVASLSSDTMAGLKVQTANPADYLIFDHAKALELFESQPTHEVLGPGRDATTFDIWKVGQAKSTYVTKDRGVTWQTIEGVPKGSMPLATVAQLQWFNEQGIPTLVVGKDVLAGTPKLAQFLIASGGKVVGETVSLDSTALNSAAKFLNKEHLPEMLGGTKLPYSIVDEMAAKGSSVVAALHDEVVSTSGLTRISTFTINGATVSTDWTRSTENIYWRSMGQTAASVGDRRATAVAQLRSFVTDMAQNANLGRLDVDARVFADVPNLRDVLAKFGATEERSADGSTFWSMDRARAEKLRTALDKDLGDLTVAPVGYAADQARLINWPAAENLTLDKADARAALGGQTRKAIFTDANGDQWLFKPGASGRGAVTDQATSELALRLGLPVPTAKVYTLNVAAVGQPENLVQGSLYKMLPNVKPVDLASLTPSQVQDVMRQSVLDWVVANDDAHAGNYLINAADDKVWGIDKSRAWVEFHQAHDVLNRASEGNLGGTPLIFKFFREAVADPSKLGAIHPSTITVTLRHLQEISDDEFKRIVGPVADAATMNPRYKNNPDKFLADMLDRKHSAASDFEQFFRTQIKDAMATDPSKVPAEWQAWLTKGGIFDLTATPQDLWKEEMADLDTKFGTYSPDVIRQKLSATVFQPIRSEITTYFSSGATGHQAGKYGSELIRPRLDRKGLSDTVKEWEDLNKWGLLHIVSGDPGPQDSYADAAFRKFWNPDTGTFRITHSTDRYGRGSAADPQRYVDGMNREGIRNLIGTAVGTHVQVAARDGVFYYIDLPYNQVFSAYALGYGAGSGEMEVLAADVRPEQVIAIRPASNRMDLDKLMSYNGPVISKVA
jgi:hypothetical protein